MAGLNRRTGLLWSVVGLSILAILFLICSICVDYWAGGVVRHDNSRTIYNYGLYHGYQQATAEREMYIRGQTGELKMCCDTSSKLCMLYSQSIWQKFANLAGTTKDCTQLIKDTLKRTLTAQRAKRFMIPYGLYVTTIFFVALGALFGVISIVFGFVNAVCTPVARFTSAFGLYVWNGLAVISLLVAVCCGGAMSLYIPFLDYILEPRDTIAAWSYTGFGYWFVFVSMLMYIANIGLVHSYRRYYEAVSQDPQRPQS